MTFSMSAVSLFEWGELRCIKAVSNNNDNNRDKGLHLRFSAGEGTGREGHAWTAFAKVWVCG